MATGEGRNAWRMNFSFRSTENCNRCGGARHAALICAHGQFRLQGPRFDAGFWPVRMLFVLADGVEIRSCITPASRVVGKSLTTLEGLPAYYALKMKLASPPALHPLQEAMIAEQAVQCGYCYNGQIIKGAELLFKNPRPTEAQIRSAMNGHLCRCGTYPRILQAIQRASKAMS